MKKLEEYKSGKYIQVNDYKAFIPTKINYNWGWDDTKLDKLLAEANRQIGELNAYSLLIPNVDLYIKMHVKIEANKLRKSYKLWSGKNKRRFSCMYKVN